jgi:hypothetical protein
MAVVKVSDEIAVSGDVLWALVRDFGNVAWIPGATNVKLQGKGPGMIRFLGEKNEIHEQLEKVDEAGRSIVYSIPVGIPFPVTGYRSTMKVSDAGPGRARLDWSAEIEPKGVPEAQAVAMIDGIYKLMIGWIRDHLAKK